MSDSLYNGMLYMYNVNIIVTIVVINSIQIQFNCHSLDKHHNESAFYCSISLSQTNIYSQCKRTAGNVEFVLDHNTIETHANMRSLTVWALSPRNSIKSSPEIVEHKEDTM